MKEAQKLSSKIEQKFTKAVNCVPLEILESKQGKAKKGELPFSVSVFRRKIQKGKFTSQQQGDPFAPPFEDDGMFITELDPDHRLIFNKFYLVKNHVLIITRNYELQTDLLTEKDF